MKKVIIIGAGIAGLTCAIYAKRNGFDTEIYELHTLPGGECTGWDRGDYHFDGCIHWLVGSKPGTSFHKIWRDTGALDDTVKILNHEIFARYEEKETAINFYSNVDRLKAHLIEIAPEDKKEIHKLDKTLRKIANLEMPIEKPMDMLRGRDGLKLAIKNIGGFLNMSKYRNMSMDKFISQFKNPLLKESFLALFPADYTAMSFLSTLGSMNNGDSGYPIGGSRALAKRMEKHYLDLGGRIFYKSKVDKILVKGNQAVGIKLIGGQEAYADYIISCADGYATLINMLEDKYTPEIYKTLFAHPHSYPTITSALVFLGINAQIPYTYRNLVIKRKEPATIGGVTIENTNILHYGFDPNMASEGNTVIAVLYDGNYDYWNALYQDQEKYGAEKKKLEDDAIAAVVERYPLAEGKIEITDVVTPMTYERYCNAWRGAWMTWVKPSKNVPNYFPGLLPGLKNFMMAGMWTLPPGGLPGAAAAGRFAAHRLCLENGMAFKTS